MRPLADRMRPRTLDEVAGQQHLTGTDGVMRSFLKSGAMPSMILWGPPGVGKTTLAEVLSHQSGRPFFQLSAVHSGVKDVRKTLKKAESKQFFNRPAPILFIDEIHRFSKSQQDALLPPVEKGIIVLIGATTENPSFEVISALLSRCQVYTLNPLDSDELLSILHRAMEEDEVLSKRSFEVRSTDALLRYSGGDARQLLNILELLADQSEEDEPIVIDDRPVVRMIQENPRRYDKGGDAHYDTISAFIKSVRGSDPQAAVYWLARMIDAGEDEKFISRRMIILAAEDIGLANPNALLLANACFDAVQSVGFPEARIILSQCAIYLASSPKSNSAYLAINEAQESVRKTGNLAVPLHLRNAPTQLMKDLDYGKDYRYAHDYAGHFVRQDYLPDKLRDKIFYKPAHNRQEEKIRSFLSSRWINRYESEE